MRTLVRYYPGLHNCSNLAQFYKKKQPIDVAGRIDIVFKPPTGTRMSPQGIKESVFSHIVAIQKI